MTKAADYVAIVRDRVAIKWPEIRGQLAEAYGDHPGLAEERANQAEAELAALAIGLQALDRAAQTDVAQNLRAEVRDAVRAVYETDDAAVALMEYEDLWRRTLDPKGFGMGFVMQVLGDEPDAATSELEFSHHRTEKLVGGALIEAALGVWEEVLAAEE